MVGLLNGWIVKLLMGLWIRQLIFDNKPQRGDRLVGTDVNPCRKVARCLKWHSHETLLNQHHRSASPFIQKKVQRTNFSIKTIKRQPINN